jgi:phosphatidylserine decarboxylase
VPGHLAISQIRAVFSPIHSDGYKFVAGAALAAWVAFYISNVLGWIGVCAALFLAFFFRDPKRITPTRDSLVIAPSDGTVIADELATPPAELGLGDTPMRRVSTFLSLFDVHVTRSPFTGQVKAAVHRPGEHRNAADPEAPAVNETYALAIEMKNGVQAGVVLVAGTVARRIVPSVRLGDNVCAGERIGIIRFGSRTDIYLPAQTNIFVGIEQRTIAGETVIADLDSAELQRTFRKI